MVAGKVTFFKLGNYHHDQVCTDNGKNHCFTDSPGSAINFELKSALKIAICSCPKKQSVVGGQAFLLSFKEIQRLSSFSSSSVDSEVE